MMTMLRNIFTGVDNTTFDMGRVLWFLTHIGYLALSVWHVAQGGAIDFVQWASGAGLVLGAGGASLMVKSKTEPGG